MPAPDKFYDQLRDRLRNESDRKVQDRLLDLWNNTLKMATEWDAKMWGLDQDKELNEILYMISQQGKVSRTVRKPSPE